MVAHRTPLWRSIRGVSRVGCLLFVLLGAVIGYYGVGIGSVYFSYWRFREEMRSQARLAPSIDDAAIHRRLIRTIEELNLPEEARSVTIKRMARPRQIQISTTYHVVLQFPFFTYVVTFTPSANQPL